MNIITEITPIYQVGGTAIGSGGTVSGAAIDWSATYEPQASIILSMGATPSGTVIGNLQQSADGTTFSTLGTVAPASGTVTAFTSSTAITQRYVRASITSTGGTALASAVVVGKKRTL